MPHQQELEVHSHQEGHGGERGEKRAEGGARGRGEERGEGRVAGLAKKQDHAQHSPLRLARRVPHPPSEQLQPVHLAVSA